MTDYTITLNVEQVGYLHTLLEEITDYWSRVHPMPLSYNTHVKKLQNIIEQIRPVKKDMVDLRREYYDEKVDKLEKKIADLVTRVLILEEKEKAFAEIFGEKK